MKNEYLPYPAIIKSIRKESTDVRTLKIVPQDKTLAKSFNYKPGQFMQLSLLGIGEAPISIASAPSQKGYLEFTVRGMGKLTQAIIKLKAGETIYIRGPYGNSFPFTYPSFRISLTILLNLFILTPIVVFITFLFIKSRKIF